MAPPKNLPLDERFVEVKKRNGETTTSNTIPALDSHWIHDEQFPCYEPPPRYEPPPLDPKARADVDAWLDRMKRIQEQLHWLLILPHDRFWCQIVFDKSFNVLIDSYLKTAPRPYDIEFSQMTSELREPHNVVHRKVFMTCLRMATYKESKEDYITPCMFGEILYENYIFDIPKIMDMCALYGQGNGELLSKMVANIFQQQPKYEVDLRGVITAILDSLNTILSKCGLDDTFSSAPIQLNDQRSEAIKHMGAAEFQDVIFYLVDYSCTLSSFLEIYPMSRLFFHEANLCLRLASFYELILPALTAALKTKKFEIPSAKSQLKNRLSLVKKLLLGVFHDVLSHCCIQPILERSINDDVPVSEVADYVEDYLQTVTAIMSERRFLADYEGQYNIQNDLDILRQSPVTIDETRLSFLQEVFDSAFSLYGKRNQPKGSRNAGGRRSPDGSEGDSEERLGAVGNQPAYSAKSPTSAGTSKLPDNMCEGAGAAVPGGAELESLIYSIKDLFPDFGDGFIEMCLIEMAFNAESVINALLENKLPHSLRELNRSMQRGETIKRVPSPPPSVLDARHNVFDYDEFDVFHRNTIDTTKIHKGKKDDVQDVQLNDPAELKELRPMYELYGSVDADTIYDKKLLEFNLYDDEYDDTYDDQDANWAVVRDTDNVDDLVNQSSRQFTTPRVLLAKPSRDRGAAAGNVSESESSEEELDERTAKRNPHDFVEDPAKLREIREARWRSKRGGNPGWSSRTVAPQPGQEEKPLHDVKGRGRGKGQSQEVTHNRQWKEKHKGTKGNHNRRALADRKQSKGFGLLGPMK